MQWPFHFKENKRCFWVSGREERLSYVSPVNYRLKSDFRLFINSSFISNYRRAVTGLILAKWTDPISLGIVLHIWRKREEVLIIVFHAFGILMKYFQNLCFLYPGLLSWVLANGWGEKSVVELLASRSLQSSEIKKSSLLLRGPVFLTQHLTQVVEYRLWAVCLTTLWTPLRHLSENSFITPTQFSTIQQRWISAR